MALKRYNVDPVNLCQCGQYSGGLELIEVQDGRYMEAEEVFKFIDVLLHAIDAANTKP